MVKKLYLHNYTHLTPHLTKSSALFSILLVFATNYSNISPNVD